MKKLRKTLILSLASAMTVVSVACQNKFPDEATSPSYTELQVQSGVKPVETPVITTSVTDSAAKASSETSVSSTTKASFTTNATVTTASAESTTDNTYRASLDRKVEDGKVVLSPADANVTTKPQAANTSRSNGTNQTTEKKEVQSVSPVILESKATNVTTNDSVKTPSEESNSVSIENDTSSLVPTESTAQEYAMEPDITTNEARQSYAPPTRTAPGNVYLVQENDCLWNIAEAHGITIYELAYANNMDIEDTIIVGQKLIIPESDCIIDEILQDTESQSDVAPECAIPVNDYYIVVNGDSFYSIAYQFGLSAEQLATANGMSIYDTICPGDLLTIPSSTGIVNSEQLYSTETEIYNFNADDTDDVDNAITSDTVTAEVDTTSTSDAVTSDETVSIDNTSYTEVAAETDSVSTDYTPESETITSTDSAFEDSTNVSDEYYSNDILSTIKNFEVEYVGTNIGMGIYSLDGTPLFEYNTYAPISGACTVKAAYAYYVLSTCEAEGIDIWNEYLTYQEGMRNNGSGIIKNSEFGSEYTISYLLTQLLNLSDNTAYNILLSRFSLDGYQAFLNNIGGQQLYGLQYGTVSVAQRRNEWLAIYNYINSGSYYSYTLQQMLTGTNYCYLVQGMANYHSYMHKSGWCSGSDYTAACDCAIIDNRYLVIVLSQDYYTGTAHTDIVNILGREAEIFMG